MIRRALLPLLLAACAPNGYREPQDSAELERDIADRNIESRVRIALSRDPQTAPYDSIRVRSEGGVVALDGKVAREAARARAVQVARECDGVVDVIDGLR